jgi:hypothetical protein
MKVLPFVALYLAAIVLANLSVERWGPEVAIYNAFLLIGLDLVARDRLHDAWRGRWLWPRMAALIATGSLLSWLVNADAGKIALASFVAFAAASTADAFCYHGLRRLPWLERANGSNLVGAGVDSLVFPWIAFGAFLWPVVFGLFCAKVAGGLLWSLVLRHRQVATA